MTPMDEYIKRKRVIVDACNSLELYPSEYKKLEDAITNIPAADVAPVRHGKWAEWYPPMNMIMTGEEMLYKCSECGVKYDNVDGYGYCPYCGAKMDGDANEKERID